MEALVRVSAVIALPTDAELEQASCTAYELVPGDAGEVHEGAAQFAIAPMSVAMH